LKDTDFYYPHLLTQQPYKLVLVRTGNIGRRELKDLFARKLPQIERALARHSRVEVGRTTVHVVV
jgi:predicted nuclease of predicted toxin-antitoxin system